MTDEERQQRIDELNEEISGLRKGIREKCEKLIAKGMSPDLIWYWLNERKQFYEDIGAL